MKSFLKEAGKLLLASTGGVVAGNMLQLFAPLWVLLMITGAMVAWCVVMIALATCRELRIRKLERELNREYHDAFSGRDRKM